jgi:hypothetical protein
MVSFPMFVLTAPRRIGLTPVGSFFGVGRVAAQRGRDSRVLPHRYPGFRCDQNGPSVRQLPIGVNLRDVAAGDAQPPARPERV